MVTLLSGHERKCGDIGLILVVVLVLDGEPIRPPSRTKDENERDNTSSHSCPKQLFDN
jgi:hypothetical protein